MSTVRHLSDGANSIAIGDYTYTYSDGGIAIGYTLQCEEDEVYQGKNNIQMGSYCVVDSYYNGQIVIGQGSQASGQSAIAMGYYTTVEGRGAIAMGYYGSALGDFSIAIGYLMHVYDGSGAICLGYYTHIGYDGDGTNSIAIGAYAEVQYGRNALMIGQSPHLSSGDGLVTVNVLSQYSAHMTGARSTSIGYGVANTYASSSTLGYASSNYSYGGTAIGSEMHITEAGFYLSPVRSDSGGTALKLLNTGEMVMDPSSARFKTNVRDMDALKVGRALDRVPVRRYAYKKEQGGAESIGFIAEEMARFLPEVVTRTARGLPQSIDYEKLTAVLWHEAVHAALHQAGHAARAKAERASQMAELASLVKVKASAQLAN